MTRDSPIKFAFNLGPEGVSKIAADDRKGTFDPGRPIWLHLDQSNPQAMTRLAKCVPAMDAIARRAAKSGSTGWKVRARSVWSSEEDCPCRNLLERQAVKCM